MKRVIIRCATAAAVIVLAVAMYYIGRSHQVVIDNHSIEEMKAFKMCEVAVDNQPFLEVFRNDRVLFEVTGGRHTITLSYLERGAEVVLEKKFSIPSSEDAVLISLPRLCLEDEVVLESL